MIKLFWYFISLLTIVIILSYSPSNSSNVGINSSLLNFRSNQKEIVRITIISIFLFFVFTILITN